MTTKSARNSAAAQLLGIDLAGRTAPGLTSLADLAAQKSMRGVIGANVNAMEDVHTESLTRTMQRWAEWQATTCGPSTIEQRTLAVERFAAHAAAAIGTVAEAVDPRRLGVEEIAAYLARPGLSANSKTTYYGHLACWFGWLHRTGRIPTDPTTELRRPRPRSGLPRPLTREQVRQVFATDDVVLKVMMSLALYAGLRAHEVAAFRGEQIVGRHLFVTGKGDKPARLPLDEQLEVIAASMPSTGWWFPSPWPHHDHVLADTVSRMVRDRFRACGVTSGSIHRLRHTFGTEVQRSCGDLRVTQELMRHSSPATTAIYTEVQDASMRSALSGLPRLSA